MTMQRLVHSTHAFLSWLCLATLGMAACAGDDTDEDADATAADSSGDGPATSSGAEAGTSSADDGTSGSDTAADTSTGEDPFAGCDRGTLEADLIGVDATGNPVPLAWFGPGADPMTGELIAEGTSFVVSSTYLAIKPEAAAQQAFGESVAPLVPALLANPGVVAIQLASSMQCGTARTFTVWQDEAAMMAFVVGDAHANAIARTPEISRGGSVVTHWNATSIAEITWDEAIVRIAADEGPFY
jgi:hypothetical protein